MLRIACLQFLDNWWYPNHVYIIVAEFTHKWELMPQLPPYVLAAANRRGKVLDAASFPD
jgi:hypothetical protein